jgi:hypothetical protein
MRPIYISTGILAKILIARRMGQLPNLLEERRNSISTENPQLRQKIVLTRDARRIQDAAATNPEHLLS